MKKKEEGIRDFSSDDRKSLISMLKEIGKKVGKDEYEIEGVRIRLGANQVCPGEGEKRFWVSAEPTPLLKTVLFLLDAYILCEMSEGKMGW